VLHIGGWALLARGAETFLRYALPHGDVGAKAYLAAVQRAGAVWTVTNIGTELVHFRR